RGTPAEPTDAEPRLAHASRLATHHHLVLLISDVAGAGQESGRLVTCSPLTTTCSSPSSTIARGGAAGRRVMCEGERQLEVDTSPRSLRDHYQSEFARRRATMSELARQRQISVLPLDTASDVTVQLRDLLGRRLSPRPATPAGQG